MIPTPKKLNFTEFALNLIEPNKLLTKPYSRTYSNFPTIKAEKPACNPLDEPFAFQLKVRSAVRKGLDQALRDTWPAKKQEIQKAISKGRLSDVIKLYNTYLTNLSIIAGKGNIHLQAFCERKCLFNLYQIEALGSSTSLNSKHPNIKNFWRDTGKIFDRLLRQAERKGIGDLPLILRGISTDKIKHEPLPDESVHWDSWGTPYKYYWKDYNSNYTLMHLLQKTNPQIVKRIQRWLAWLKFKDYFLLLFKKT